MLRAAARAARAARSVNGWVAQATALPSTSRALASSAPTPTPRSPTGAVAVAVAAAAATGLGYAWFRTTPSASPSLVTPSVPPQPHPPTAARAPQAGAGEGAPRVDRAALLADLRVWLVDAGADVGAVEIRPCSENSTGVGVFATPAAADRNAAAAGPFRRALTALRLASPADAVLASFPLALAVTPAAAMADPVLGSAYADLVASGAADGRALVMLFLAVERAKGRASRWAPWLAALPREFGTPLHFEEDDLRLLAGTTLGKAAASLRARLAAAWARLAPAAADLAREAGLATAPTLDDFTWAYSTFWSRGMAFPAPTPAGDAVATEGILPGLDFCNHGPAAAVRWTVWRSPRPDPASPPVAAALVAPAGAVAPGDEILIDYGDKSQEELLLLYGFAHAATANGVLMVPCPLPADGAAWDADLEDRLELLRVRGLAPQVFLPADGPGGGSRAGARRGSLWPRRASAAPAPGGGDLPDGVWPTLEAFVLDPGDVRTALKEAAAAAVGGGGAAGADAPPGPPPSSSSAAADPPGLRMAVLTTLARLLETTVVALEGEGGTGPLEADVALLEDDAAGRSPLPPTHRACVAYRAGQKRAARLWLVEARRLLEEEVARFGGDA